MVLGALPLDVERYLESQGWGRVSHVQAAAGGCINDGRVLSTTSGPRLFLKQNRASPAGMFAREAEGLSALHAAAGGPRVPVPYLAGDDFLLLEYLEPARPAPNYWTAFAQRLARLHAGAADRFGFAHDNYIGSTPQPNTWQDDGYEFFAEQRLRFQGRLARQRGLLDERSWRRLDQLAGRLEHLIPAQPPSLIHGDLWSGNVIPGPGGEACLIDPAAHYGWAEADLAMLSLFGQPPAEFYTAYEAERPLAPGYRERFDLYNLYHLLNHLNLFGGSYRGSVEGILAAYS